MSQNDNITKAHCNECLRETNHLILHKKVEDVSDIDETSGYVILHAEFTYEMLICCGCDHVTFRRTYHGDDDPEGSIQYYPPAISRQRPAWLNAALGWDNYDLHQLINEVYSALHMGSQRLAMMGLRAIIDMVIVKTVGDIGGFQTKLDALVEKGFVSSRNRECLAAALDLGSAAAHRGHSPTSAEVGQVMDIVENLLQSVFALNTIADSLRKKTPPRPPRPRNTEGDKPSESRDAQPQGEIEL